MAVPASDRNTAPSSPWSPALVCIAAAGFVSLLVITVAPLGATRMYAWPWSIAYVTALLAPACILLSRAANPRIPLVLPPSAWTATLALSAAVVVASAMVSPYRATALLGAAPYLAAIAVFFIVFDWRHAAGCDPTFRSKQVWRTVGWASALVALASLTEWLAGLQTLPFGQLLANRNPYPLGHSNYTAGLAVLMLPCFSALAARAKPVGRVLALVGVVVALGLLFTSGSRGGMIALAALAVAGVALLQVKRTTKLWIAGTALVATGILVAAQPRTRAMLQRMDPTAAPNISNVQRGAMLLAGERLGADRPLLGWGPGTTPLAFPRYRAELPGGAENVLQLHSLPVQIWAELGFAGIACALAVAALLLRHARNEIGAAVALGGYAVFAAFDAQIDVPVFGFGVATLFALLPKPESRQSRASAIALATFTLAALGIVVVAGHRDAAPMLNVEALRDDVGRAQPKRSAALLRESLALNPDQEIAHFNLGWLLLVDDPAAAAKHFTSAAKLVPDKGGVYFGLGLARLNSGDHEGAAEAFALEALNDPLFLLSPWWETPQIRALQGATRKALARYETMLGQVLPPTRWAGRELRYIAKVNAWIAGEADSAAVAAVATTPARRDFFSVPRDAAVVRAFTPRTLRNQRIGYPVLMRDLDLPAPSDLYEVHEPGVRQSPLAHLWPEKGWLPSPLLIALLEHKPLPTN